MMGPLNLFYEEIINEILLLKCYDLWYKLWTMVSWTRKQLNDKIFKLYEWIQA
jgi:hypothetical protein